MSESFNFFEKAQQSLKPHTKVPMLEEMARKYIHDAGVLTFPKPIGIPENYIVKITDKGAGMEYSHPTNVHLSVRVMPGKSHSEYIHQQKPYVVQMKDGKALDKFGNKVDKRSPEAHVPIDEYFYKGD